LLVLQQPNTARRFCARCVQGAQTRDDLAEAPDLLHRDLENVDAWVLGRGVALDLEALFDELIGDLIQVSTGRM